MEPWLRGPIEDLDPIRSHLIYTYTQCREELARWTAGLADGDAERPPAAGIPTLGFHLRHIAGSVDRLTTYLEGQLLTGAQLAYLRAEAEPSASIAELLAAIDQQFDRSEQVARGFALDELLEPRRVGRQELPTTVGGLIIHLSEHTQRHLGQAILTAKLLHAASAR